MQKIQYKIGTKINKWELIGFCENVCGRPGGLFKCECGIEKKQKINFILSGRSPSCKRCSNSNIPIINDKFNKLTYTKFIGYKNNLAIGLFVCDCINKTEKEIPITQVRSNHIKSCGCLRIETALKHCNNSITHGMTKTKEYSRWFNLKTKYDFCEDWMKFENYHKDIGYMLKDGYCLLRLDETKPYSLLNIKIVKSRVAGRLNYEKTCLEKYGIKCHLDLPENYRISKREEELRLYLNSFGFNFEKTRKIIDKEIDMYDDNLKIGIEYCGLYWHTDISPEPRLRNYHYNKWLQCKNKDIQLITIFEDEYKSRKSQILNRLKSLLNKNERIFARKCTVQLCPTEEAFSFVNTYHIQPIRNKPMYAYGLYYNNELIEVVTINKHHRKSDKFVLNRFCSKEDVSVIGGFSKILSFIKKENKFTELTTWSDNRWSTGNVYFKNGFTLDKELKPDYSYVYMNNPKKRKSKQSCTKKALKIPDDISESLYMKNLGYGKIWDCGKKRFIIKL